eukprot:g27039.t1
MASAACVYFQETPQQPYRLAPYKALSIAAVCSLFVIAACFMRVRKAEETGMDAIAKWDSSEASGQCGNMEKNLDYANPKCKSFVWVEDAGLPGNPSQCWLKGGEPVDKKPKDGVVAGIPPPRQPFQMVPQEASPDQFPVDRAGMFCFSLMLPFGYEVELLAWQYNQQVSIFACDKFAVYTNKSMEVGAGTGLYTHVVDSNLHCQVGGDSQSALNSWIFIAVWKKVLEDGYWREYPWTVKVDPDAVFLPLRARPILMQYYGEPREQDMFMDQCLRKVLQVTDGQPPALAPELMCEAHCDCPEWIWCSGSAVSFHPFKSIASYKNCLANAFSGRENDIKGLSGPDGALQFWLKLGGLPNGADCRLSRGADGTWRYYEVTSQGNTSIGEATLKNGLGDIPEDDYVLTPTGGFQVEYQCCPQELATTLASVDIPEELPQDAAINIAMIATVAGAGVVLCVSIVGICLIQRWKPGILRSKYQAFDEGKLSTSKASEDIEKPGQPVAGRIPDKAATWNTWSPSHRPGGQAALAKNQVAGLACFGFQRPRRGNLAQASGTKQHQVSEDRSRFYCKTLIAD